MDDPTQAVYAFYHTTFEEYFAALAIDDWDFLLPREHGSQLISDRAFLLAALGIAEFKDCTRADEIVAQGLKVAKLHPSAT